MDTRNSGILIVAVLSFHALAVSSASAQTWTANPAPVANGNYYYQQIGVDATFDWGAGSQAYAIDIYLQDPAIPRQIPAMAAPILSYDMTMTNKIRIHAASPVLGTSGTVSPEPGTACPRNHRVAGTFCPRNLSRSRKNPDPPELRVLGSPRTRKPHECFLLEKLLTEAQSCG